MAATDSESDCRSVNKTLYAPLPQQHSAADMVLDENAQTDELLEALQFLRSKVKDLTSQPPSPRKEEETQTEHTINTATNGISPITTTSHGDFTAPTYAAYETKPILSKNSARSSDSSQKVVRISDCGSSIGSALQTPRKLSPDITEQIRNRISTILRPPEYDMSTYHKITSIDPGARVFLDESILDPNQSGYASNPIPLSHASQALHKPPSKNSTSSQTPRTSGGLNQEIEHQLKSADLRCEALEKQLDQMRHIVKKTTEQNSCEIEKIIRDSRREAQHFDQMKDEQTKTQLYKSTKNMLLTDEDFVEKVMQRLKQEKLSRKKLAKISKKLAIYGMGSENIVERLREVSGANTETESDKVERARSDSRRGSLAKVTGRSGSKINTARSATSRVQTARASSRSRVADVMAKSAPIARSHSACRVKGEGGGNRLSKTTPGFAMDTTASRERRIEAQRRRQENNQPPTHYYIKLADIPFVAGKNVGKSYHTGANIQQLLHDLKTSRTLIKPTQSAPSLARKKSSGGLPLPASSKRDLFKNVQSLRQEIRTKK